ncbi:hypothetical protein AX15_000622 [Amanita polypyramis BW_CC]|nr:hypothetical protein AX15_000622 [Amanita polypyramis BW_CC]
MIIPEKEMALNMPSFEVSEDSGDYFEVYTHRSIRRPDSRGNALAFVGERLLNFEIARYWFEKLPNASPQELQEKQIQSLSDDLLEDCIVKYRLHSKLRGGGRTISLEDCRDFLNIYIGALFAQDGVSAVQRWVSALIDRGAGQSSTTPGSSSAGPPASPVPSTSTPSSPTPSSITTLSSLTLSPIIMPSSLSLAQPPPPYSSTGSNSNEDLNYVTVSLFNEYAQKRNYIVDWKATHSGEAHRLTWTVKCLLNGEVKGAGIATSQKTAKEIAVRGAWQTMGWGGTATSLTVARFMECATQRSHEVEWETELTGQAHMPTWRATCIVDGRHTATGIGRNTNEAKQQAVRIAWENMGW